MNSCSIQTYCPYKILKYIKFFVFLLTFTLSFTLLFYLQ